MLLCNQQERARRSARLPERRDFLRPPKPPGTSPCFSQRIRLAFFGQHEEKLLDILQVSTRALTNFISQSASQATSLTTSAGINASVVMDIIGHEPKPISAHYTQID